MKKEITEKEINKTIKKINATMELEGMPLEQEDKDRIAACMKGETTVENEIEKLNEKYGKKKE